MWTKTEQGLVQWIYFTMRNEVCLLQWNKWVIESVPNSRSLKSKQIIGFSGFDILFFLLRAKNRDFLSKVKEKNLNQCCWTFPILQFFRFPLMESYLSLTSDFSFLIAIFARLLKKEVDKLHSFLEYSLAYLSSREIIWLLPARLFWKRLNSTFCPCSAVVLSLNIFIRP